VTKTIRILFLAAGNDDESRSRSQQEARAITEHLRKSEERDSFEVITRWAVRVSELQGHLLELQPHVVHLSGQATEAGEILLSDDREGQQTVSLQAMAELFRILKDNIRVVVLNLPHSDGLAHHLRWLVDFTVSMRGVVERKAAVTFSAHLYQALGYGRTVSEAFELAVNQLMLDGHAGYRNPALFVRVGANTARRLMPDSAAPGTSETIRQLSHIAAGDAQFIMNDRFGIFGGDVRLDQGLYVDRKIEQSLSQILAKRKTKAPLVLIVGEAGHGKTSLLWHVYHSLPRADQWEPLFIKSTLFLGRNASRRTARVSLTATFNRDSLLAAAADASENGLQPVILLDTVDLLLRDEEGRNFLLKLAMTLQEKRCFVVATCRPQEAMLLFSLDPIKLTLREYDESELNEAINKHAARFYAPSVRKNYAEEFAHLLNAVARGLPVREVCSNPLTLRMLFSIYAPAAIPEDINVFKLYQEYWTHRVEQDLRAGNPLGARSSPDLRKVAAGVALAMLAEGTPELDWQRLESALTELGRTKDGVSDLVDRGILNDSESGTVTFFHQTFFEHSAARGLLIWRGIEGLSVLRERGRLRPNDLFVSPVFEHALLLSEGQTSRIAEAADAFLVELIQSDVLTLMLSGIYVYCHRQTVPAATASIMRTFLLTAAESSVMRFLELAPNTSSRRIEMLFSELDVIWGRGNWREQEHVLKLLERLVPRSCFAVRKFVEQHDLLKYVLSKPRGFPGEWKLLRMLTAMAEYDQTWSLRMLIELYLKAIPRVESRELQTAVLNALCDRADLFGKADLATRFEEATAHVNLDRARNVEALSIAYGRLLSVEWRAHGRSVTSIVREIKQMEHGLKLIARMRGLVFVLLEGDENDAEVAFSSYKTEVDTPREWLWTRVVWPQILLGGEPTGSISPVVAYARREANRILSEQVSCGADDVADSLAGRIRTSIREASLPPEELLKLLDISALSNPVRWLSLEQYVPLLADAFVAGHAGAVAAMNQLLTEPERLWPAVRQVVSPRLKRLSASGGRSAEALLIVSLKTEDAANLLRALEQSLPGAYQSQRDELLSFQQRLLRSPSARKRSTAVLIWSQLLRLMLAPAPELQELRLLLANESDACTRGHLITFISQTLQGAEVDINDVVDLLVSLAMAKDTDTREKALASVLKIVSKAPEDPGPYAMRLLNAALAPPTNAARLSLMRPLVKRLIDTDVKLAAATFERLLTESRTAGLGFNGSRTLLGRFKSVARALVRAAPPAISRRLVASVPTLDRALGVLVVDSVCQEVRHELNSELDELLKQDIHNDVKQVILKYKHTHERAAGWPELYALLHRDTLIEAPSRTNAY